MFYVELFCIGKLLYGGRIAEYNTNSEEYNIDITKISHLSNSIKQQKM